MYITRKKPLSTVETIYCRSVKQRSEIIRRLKRQYEKVKINVIEDLIIYETWEVKESNLYN